MLKILGALFAGFLTIAPAWADSTIDPALPANGQPYSAATVRGQFDAAVNDINALQSLNIGTSQPFACNLANAGRVWVDNSTSSLWKLNYCDGSGATWVPGGYIDTIKHLFTPPTGRGECQSIVAAATTDLGSVPQSCINVTGNSNIAITSFGATAKAGDIKVVTFTGTNTLVYNAVNMVLPGAINATTSPADNWIFQSTGLGNWIAVSRSSQTAVTAVAPPGTGTKVRSFLSVAAPSTTVAADGFVVCTALSNGTCYELGAYSQTFNSSLVGAGGMDTGVLPSSGYVCIYAIYNPITATASIIGVNCNTSATTIYSGANLPSGYTASALIASWPTNSTPNLVAGGMNDRHFAYQTAVSVLSNSSTPHASPTALSVSSAIPPNAIICTPALVITTNGSNAAGYNNVSVTPTSTDSGANIGFAVTVPATTTGNWSTSASGLSITASQVIYYKAVLVDANSAVYIFITDYTW